MAEFKLHCFAASGNSYKVALFLALANADWEPVVVDYFGGETRTETWRDNLNEMGEIPVLEHAGLKISQSGVILDYLAAATGKFGARDEQEKRDIWRWILFDNHKFTSYYATLRYMVGLQKTGDTPVTKFLLDRVVAAYRIVDKHLAGAPFLVGDRLTIADLSLAGYVYLPEETGIDMADFPHIAAWKERISDMPGWRHPHELMPGRKTL